MTLAYFVTVRDGLPGWGPVPCLLLSLTCGFCSISVLTHGERAMILGAVLRLVLTLRNLEAAGDLGSAERAVETVGQMVGERPSCRAWASLGLRDILPAATVILSPLTNLKAHLGVGGGDVSHLGLEVYRL